MNWKSFKTKSVELIKFKGGMAKKGIDMNALTKGAIGFGVAIVGITVAAVITDKLGNTSGLGTSAQNVANNGTSLLSDIMTDWGAIIVLGLILAVVLAPLLFVLIQVAKQGGR